MKTETELLEDSISRTLVRHQRYGYVDESRKCLNCEHLELPIKADITPEIYWELDLDDEAYCPELKSELVSMNGCCVLWQSKDEADKEREKDRKKKVKGSRSKNKKSYL